MTMNEAAIQQIIEMGFSKEDAIHALEATNGDVNQALNLMFQAQDDPTPAAVTRDETSIVPLQDYSEPDFAEGAVASDPRSPVKYDQAPPLPSRHNNSSQPSHIENVESYEVPREYQETHHRNYSDERISREVPDYNDYSVYSDITKYERPPGCPAVLMPINNGYFESYLNPILTILHEITTFRHDIFKPEFSTLGFHQRWFQGSPINIPMDAAEIRVEGEKHNLSFLLEVQRLFAFLEPESKRAFTSIRNFINSFPPDAKREFSDIESLREAYEVFQKHLTLQLQRSGIADASKYFQNQVMDDNDDHVREFGMFSIEAEEIKQNIYKTLHSLLWQDETDNKQTITKLADVAAFTFEPSYDASYVPRGLELSEVLYPQIYTSEFKEIVADTIKEFRELDKKRREVASKLMSTRVFKGKQVSFFLGQSLKFLESETDEPSNQTPEFQAALKDLQNISTTIADNKAKLMEQQAQLTEDRQKASPYNIKHLIEKSGKELEPYLLTGVILGPSSFAYLKRTETLLEDEDEYSWILTGYKENDFFVRKIGFEEIKRAVHALTSSQFETPIVLIYVKESTFISDSTIDLPTAVKEFLEKDEIALNNTLELLSSTDEELDESEEEDEIDSVEEQLIEIEEPDLSEDKENREAGMEQNP